MSDYRATESFTPRRTTNKRFLNGTKSFVSTQKAESAFAAKSVTMSSEVKPSVISDEPEGGKYAATNGDVIPTADAKMISEWIRTYRSSSKEERAYLIRKGVGFYKNNPSEFFEEGIFDVIEAFKSNDTDESLQWDGLKFIYSSLPKHSVDKLSSASSVSMHSMNSSFSIPHDDKFVRWARQISLLVAQDDKFMCKVIRFFLERKHDETNNNVAQQVLRVLCYYQPLLVCSFFIRHGVLLKEACTEIADATPRFRASFYAYLVYVIDKTPRSKSVALCREIFYTQAFVQIVRFLKTHTPVEKKPHRSVMEAAKLLARVFSACDDRIAEKYFSAVKFVEALLITCRRWCSVCELLRPHFITILRALCVHQRVLSRSIMYNSTTNANASGSNADTTTTEYLPKACLLPVLMQMSLSGDAEFFKQLIKCIRLAIADDFERNNYVFFEPIDASNADVTMINQLPRLMQSRLMKPEIRIVASRLFSDIIVPESQRVEDICTSMINNQDPLNGFLQRVYEHNDPVGVYATCFAFSKLVAVAHGSAASRPGNTSSSAPATPRAHSQQFENEFRTFYDDNEHASTTPKGQPQCLLYKLLESLDKARHPIALLGQLQFLIVFERHYSTHLVRFLRRKRVLFSIANVITLRGDVSVFSRVDVDEFAGDRAVFSSINYILALYLLTRIHDELVASGTQALLASYCERFLRSKSTQALLEYFTATNDEADAGNSDTGDAVTHDISNNSASNEGEQQNNYAHNIFKAAESYLFMPPNSDYFCSMLAELDRFCRQLVRKAAANNSNNKPSVIIPNIVLSAGKTPTNNNMKLKPPETPGLEAKVLRKQAEAKETRIREIDTQMAASTKHVQEASNRIDLVGQNIDELRSKLSEQREELNGLLSVQPTRPNDSGGENHRDFVASSDTEAGGLRPEITELKEKINICRQWMPSIADSTEQARVGLTEFAEQNGVECVRELVHIQLVADCHNVFTQCASIRQQALDEQAKSESHVQTAELVQNLSKMHGRVVDMHAAVATREAQRNALRQKAARQRSGFESDLVVLARKHDVGRKLQSLLEELNLPFPDVDISMNSTVYDGSSSFLSTTFATSAVNDSVSEQQTPS